MNARAVLGLVVAVTLVCASTSWGGSPTAASAASAASAPPSAARLADPVTTTQRALAGSRPNIVWILVDDMRADDLRYMPRTRRLLVARGVKFRNSFSPYSWCCPARASLLTGQYSHNHGVLSIWPPFGFTSFDDSSTLPVWLRRAGYRTLYLGKYLNGYGSMPRPGETTGSSTTYRPPGWTRWHAAVEGLPHTHPKRGNPYHYYDTTLSNDSKGYIALQGTYQTHAYAAITERLIAQFAPRPAPFFLVASYTAPHDGPPWQPGDPTVPDGEGGTKPFPVPATPPSVRGMFDNRIADAPGAGWDDPDPSDKPGYLQSLERPGPVELAAMTKLARKRAESLEVVDRAVHRTVAALRRSKELGRTMILFTSDNGYYLGEHHLLRGKVITHEPSIRVPAVIRGPGVPRGEVRSDPMTSVDFAPTIAAVAGATPTAPVDGVSMLKTLGSDRGWGRGILLTTGPDGESRTPFPGSRDTDMSGQPLGTEGAGEPDLRWLLGVRTPRYSYWNLATGEEELYDVLADPEQYHNLAVDPAYDAVKAELEATLTQLRACSGVSCRGPLPASLATP